MLLGQLPPLVRATTVARPSRTIKSPYVADISMAAASASASAAAATGAPALCHTPGLGCNGLVDAGATIWVSASTSETAKTAFAAQLGEVEDGVGKIYVGLRPMLSQALAGELLRRSVYPDIKHWSSEVRISDETRLDYVGHVGGVGGEGDRKVYVEVKNAMVCNELHVPRAERKSCFPDGYRKSRNDPISPRAIKHANTLAALCAEPTTAACMLLFLVSRDDCCGGLRINPDDPAYCAALWEAVRAGVLLRAFAVAFSPTSGTITCAGEVPIYLEPPRGCGL